ncbi:unnamed protein product [Fusarium fujikuroi]|uniref:Uncharacterized protein n=1 Tax=Fusarium fujikuroi TaxID=5127 RepID=A0A9Q9RPK6_FUSFU|nr:uncharacterized protein FFE2_05772 [Fusarium fujikuroi]SCV44435.1 uncharacterized protein FFFS_07021 [Fusarium fujikuroi]VTT70872.1 unnamed protein product [Fusarium fujikuroi]VTT71656.1 unnamed protein product [Fusarium fujikuroi]VZI21653.1 unnamed protein product [Fusarium fujikuroi]
MRRKPQTQSEMRVKLNRQSHPLLNKPLETIKHEASTVQSYMLGNSSFTCDALSTTDNEAWCYSRNQASRDGDYREHLCDPWADWK